MSDKNHQAGTDFHPGVIWITGYSSSGKTTVARQVEKLLRSSGVPVVWLDGDDLRNIFAARWGYDRSERVELGKVYLQLCNHLSSQGLVVVISAIAMYDEVRHWVRTNIPRYLEVYLNVPTEIILERDALTKHLYKGRAPAAHLYDPPDAGLFSLDNFGEATPASIAGQIVEAYRTKSHVGADQGKGAYWEEYYRQSKTKAPPSGFAIAMAQKLAPGQRVLEVGCGNGRDAVFFSEGGHRVTAIDQSEAAIQLCQRLHRTSSAEFFAGALPVHGRHWRNNFDVVYSRFVLHAMTLGEEIEMLRAAAEVLVPGGQILLECRSINDLLARQGEVISTTERIAGHYRRFIIPDELRERLVEAGFELSSEIEATGLAVYKDEDPVVIRMTAVKRVKP
jgi:adenylylsulfate kinase-like enzyme/2-polyprenyl-3-methyl-5-hydroxy-6-metoxy-1,4-benzoquinol methylase